MATNDTCIIDNIIDSTHIFVRVEAFNKIKLGFWLL